MGKYAYVSLFDDADRKESSSFNSLFDVKSLASIGGDPNETENNDPSDVSEKISRTCMASNSSCLAISVNSDVLFFDISEGCSAPTWYTFAEEEVCGIVWMGETHLLAVVTNTRKLHLLSTKLGLVLSLGLCQEERASCSHANITFLENDDHCVISTCDDAGLVDIVWFPHYPELLACPVDAIHNVLQKMSDDLATKHITSKLLPNLVRPSRAVPGLVSAASTSSSILSASAPKFNFEELYNFPSHSQFAAIREVCNGRYLVGVTADGQMIVYDLWSFSILVMKSLLIGMNHIVVDFFFDDDPPVEFVHSSIWLIVDNGVDFEIQVKSLCNMDTTFCQIVHKGTFFIPTSKSDVRALMFVEPDGEKLILKEVSTTDPETRFNRLIERNLLDEAELFAKQFNLDCQKVFVSRMENLFEEARNEPQNEEIFKKFLRTMDNVSDHDTVAEMCYAGATTFQNYDRILSLFAYVEKRKVTDKDRLESLASLAYVFATFRMVAGPENADFESWPAFVNGVSGPGDWIEIFYNFLEAGYISEARVIWHRHNEHVFKSMHDEIVNDGAITIFELLKEAFIRRVETWRDAIQFLEHDVVPQCLSDNTERIVCPALVDFLLYLAKNLEQIAPTEFPDNALSAASTMERLCKFLTDTFITPQQQALLAVIGRYFLSSDSGMKELTVYAHNLRAIKRLKEVYECPLSYNEFINLDAEGICYRILHEAVKNPNQVSNRVEKFARPYMNENRLDSDLTIFRYIESMSKQAIGAHSSTTPWHEYCLLVSETIKNYSLHCRAVTLIARNAKPPWDKKLNDAVKAILANSNTDSDLIKELNRVCTLANLGEILGTYSIGFNLLESVIAKEASFSRFIMYILTNSDRFTDEKRLQDSLKAVALYERINVDRLHIISTQHVYVSYGIFLQKSFPNTKPLIAFLESMGSKGEHTQQDITEAIVFRLISDINSPIQMYAQEIISERMKKISCVESIIQRFLHSDPAMDAIYKDVVCIRRMQETYKKWVTFDNLRDDGWKEDELKLFFESCVNVEVTELYLFANSLNMSRDTACQIILSIALSTEPMTLARIIREAVLSIRDPSRQLVERFLEGIQHIFGLLTEACTEETEPEILEQAMDLMVQLYLIVPNLVEFALRFEHLLELTLRTNHYICIFMLIVDQFVPEEDDKQPSGEQAHLIRDDRVAGMSRRVGVYGISNEGHILNKLDAIRRMCAVAQSVVAGENVTPAQHEEWCSKWDELCEFLALENKDILVYTCRIFSTYLPCFNHPGQQPLTLCGSLRQSAKHICERALQMHPCDLWTTSGVLMALPIEIAEPLIQELRQWVGKRKSPQTMLNYLRTVQFVVIPHQANHYYDTLKGHFIKALWHKRLGKLGISMPSKANSEKGSAIIESFAKNMLDPMVASEYLSEFWSGRVDEMMLNYVVALVSKASASNENREIEAFLQLAAIAIKQCTLAPTYIFKRLRAALYTISPYNYEPIYFLINQMAICLGGSWNDEDLDKEECSDFVNGCVGIYEFLINNRRQSVVTKAEINWYMNYQKTLQRDKLQSDMDCDMRSLSVKRHLGELVRDCFELGTTAQNQAIGRGEQDLIYERDEVLVSALPESAEYRLPMHLFLYHDQIDIQRNLVPMVEAEVNLYTVIIWRALLSKSVNWLKSSDALPQQMMLLNAVTKKVKECVDKGLDLNESDHTAIFNLFTHHCSIDDVVVCIGHCVKTLPLSTVKVQLLEIGSSVGETWLDQVEPDDREKFRESGLRLQQIIMRYKTELLLKKEGLVQALTADLVEHPKDLIGFIYSNNIDWNDDKDIERKAHVIDKLAKLNDVDLSKLQEELVHKWLLDGENAAEGFTAVDLNDTMGSAAPVVMMDEDSGNNEDLKLPIFDSSMTRIVHLLGNLQPENILMKLMQNIVKAQASNVVGGCKTIVRATCAILRAYSDDVLMKVNTNDLKLGSRIENTQYRRLLELAKEDMPFETFIKQDRTLVAKALMLPTKRQTPQICQLAACMVVDYDVVDKTVIDALVSKLCHARKLDILQLLLQYCRANKKLHSTKNLGMMWPRAFETSNAIDSSRSDKINEWIFFILSCPVEGGRYFEPVRNSLATNGLHVASTIISLAANPTRKTAAIHAARSAKDLNFRWSYTGKQPVLVEDQKSDENINFDDSMEYD